MAKKTEATEVAETQTEQETNVAETATNATVSSKTNDVSEVTKTMKTVKTKVDIKADSKAIAKTTSKMTAERTNKIATKLAILEINNMQYIVAEGETITCRIDLDPTATPEVNLLGLVFGSEFTYGTPYLTNKVDFKLGEIVKGDKVITAKFKAKSRYRRKVGFRPHYIEFTLNSIK